MWKDKIFTRKKIRRILTIILKGIDPEIRYVKSIEYLQEPFRSRMQSITNMGFPVLQEKQATNPRLKCLR